MYRHGPESLAGPFSRARVSWLFPAAEGLTGEPPCTPQLANSAPKEGEVRLDLVERIREEIAAGVYETPEKWEAALDQLARHLL
jgi:hypothetical protein